MINVTEVVESRGYGDVPPELIDVLWMFGALSESHFARALGYVVVGDHSELLAELAADPDDSLFEYLGAPGDLERHRNDTQLAALKNRIGKNLPDWTVTEALEARNILYSRIELLSAVQVVRLGRLLVASRGVKPVWRSSPLGPDWLHCLLVDVLQKGWRPWVPGVDGSAAPPWEERLRSAWTPGYLHALLEADRQGSTASDVSTILSVLFDRADSVRHPIVYSNAPLVSFSRLVGLHRYVTDNAATLAPLIAGYAIEGRRQLIALAQLHPDTVPALTDIVRALVQDASKTVRSDALVLVASLRTGPQVELLEPLLLAAPAVAIADIISALSRTDQGIAAIGRVAATASDLAGVAMARRLSELTAGSTRIESFAPQQAAFVGTLYEPPEEAALEDDYRRTEVPRTLADALAALRKFQSRFLGTHDQEKHVYSVTEAEITQLESVTDAEIREFLRYLSEGGSPPASLAVLTTGEIKWHWKNLGLRQAARLHSTPNVNMNGVESVPFGAIFGSIPQSDIDLRGLLAAAEEFGHIHALEDTVRLCFPGGPPHFDRFSEDNIWPVFAEHPTLLAQFFGIESGPLRSGNTRSDEISAALQIVGMMPAIPASLLPHITELALNPTGVHRRQAQNLLASRMPVTALAVGALDDAAAGQRIAAATWLGRLEDPASITPLRLALADEKSPAVRAAVLTALECLGDDFGAHLTPVKLLAEAESGLKASVPASLAWFPFDQLPVSRWASSGRVVPAEILRWWVVLANKLKEPGGHGIIARYLSLLQPVSRETLGTVVLTVWIAHDTLLRADPADSYQGSAISSKGILALASSTPGTTLAPAVRGFMRDHPLRWMQAGALLAVAAASDDPSATQLLLAAARRHRTAAVQELARTLVDELAERRGWSADELADRTVPTAGFSADGMLHLSFGTSAAGPRDFVGRISAKGSLELADASGTVIKALPAEHPGESADLVSLARSTLTASKKELKLQLRLQTDRLYEAMCVERQWPASDFREFLLGHPLMARLVARLVWMERFSAEVDDYRIFRPDGNGGLSDADDSDVVLAATSTIQLAHSSLVRSVEATRWKSHLVDCEIAPLFRQFDIDGPVTEEFPTGYRLSHRNGWLTTAFDLRSAALARGYKRGTREVYSFFSEYVKSYPTIGIEVVMNFTGNITPEENIPVAVTTLTFRKSAVGGPRTRDLPLDAIPAVLLSESSADYRAVAETGSFDPDWHAKSGW